VLKADSDGVFMVDRWRDLAGRYFRKGETVGYVVTKTRPRVRVVVTQAEIDRVRLATDRVDLRFSPDLDDIVEGRIVRQVPAGESELPSLALATTGGGRIAIDPRDPQGAKTLERLFQFDIELDSKRNVTLFGQRVHVRFDHPAAPLATQWYAAIRRLFLTRFNV